MIEPVSIYRHRPVNLRRTGHCHPKTQLACRQDSVGLAIPDSPGNDPLTPENYWLEHSAL